MLRRILRNRNHLISILVLFLFLIEIVPTLYRFFGDYSAMRIVGIYKIFFQIAILFFIDYTNLNKRLVYYILAFFFIFIFSLLLNPLLKIEFSWLLAKGSIYYFDRYVFIFLFSIMFYSRKDKSIIVNNALKYIEFILLANAVLIILGYIFNIKMLESYINSSRFGYDGIFNKVNEVSYIYIIYLMYLYYCAFITKAKHWSLFLIIAIVSLILGTKTILLFFSLLFAFHFIFVIKNNKLYKTIALIFILGFIIFFEKLINFLFDLFPFWKNLQEEYGLLTLLFSNRDVLIRKTINYTNVNWNEINYIIGGGFYSKPFAISQMDGPDLFLFFGALGTIIYFIIFGFIFLKKKNIILNSLILIVLICGLLGGGLLMSGMSMVFLFLVSYLLNENHKLQLNK